jgi:hypothetical protein
MAMLEITSVKKPFTSPRLALEVVTALERADAMGLLPEGQRIETLDLAAFRKVVGHIQQAGIGRTIKLVLSGDMMDQTTKLQSLLEQLNAALEESPAPEYEWNRMMDVLGLEQLARLLGHSSSSVRRYKAGARTTPDKVAARLHFLALIVGELRGAYNDVGIRQWFDRKRSQLGGRTPAQLLARAWNPAAPGPTHVRELARSLSASPAT